MHRHQEFETGQVLNHSTLCFKVVPFHSAIAWQVLWLQDGSICSITSVKSGTYMAVLVLQLPVAKQHFARFDSWVSLLLVEVLQLVNVILTFRLPFLQVDVREDSLDYGDLQAKGAPINTA